MKETKKSLLEKRWDVFLLYVGFALPLIWIILYEATFTALTQPKQISNVVISIIISTIIALGLFVMIFRKYMHRIQLKEKRKDES